MHFPTNCILVQAHIQMIQPRDRSQCQHDSHGMRRTLGGSTMARTRSRRYHVQYLNCG